MISGLDQHVYIPSSDQIRLDTYSWQGDYITSHNGVPMYKAHYEVTKQNPALLLQLHLYWVDPTIQLLTGEPRYWLEVEGDTLRLTWAIEYPDAYPSVDVFARVK